ncbi:Hypothetical protein A7982_11675 [Minicystis rosea]|nr:Hypothetical protein A7982_11675 [Minicystis rosea]
MPEGDRPTPLADPALDYSSYILATTTAETQARATVRIQVSDLAPLVEQTHRTGTTERTPAVLAIIERTKQQREAGDAAQRRRRARIGAVVVVVGAAVLSLAPHLRARSSGAAPVPASAAPPAPPAPASVEAQVAPSVTPAAPAPTEPRAREALERLRGGLGDCIRHGVRALPGSSPAVPATLGALKTGPYSAPPADWKTPVWACAHFQIDEPMSFQLQWQLVKPGLEGMAIAWLDTDGDGSADRALGFRVAVGAKGAIEVGAVETVDASRPVLPIR